MDKKIFGKFIRINSPFAESSKNIWSLDTKLSLIQNLCSLSLGFRSVALIVFFFALNSEI